MTTRNESRSSNNREMDQRRTTFEEPNWLEMVDAVNAQLMNSSDSRMPISNQSRTQISRGKQSKFQD